MITKSRAVRVSKFLSYILRHKPGAAGVTPDAEGWVSVNELLAGADGQGIKISRSELDEVVATNDKQRFAFSADGQRIRANHGHSIEIDLGLRSIVPPKFLYHGTVARFIPSILKSGLKNRSRQYVHLSADKVTAQKVGERRGKAMILKVSAVEMHAEDYEFYLSENGVWLTDFVLPEFIAVLNGIG